MLQADWTKVKFNFIPEPPFLEMKLEGFESGVVVGALKMIGCFTTYVNALKDIIEEKIPDVLEKAQRMPEEAQELKDRFKYDFDNLDLMKKGKAVMATAVNLKTVSKIPSFIQ